MKIIGIEFICDDQCNFLSALVNVLLDGIGQRSWIGMSTKVANKKQWVDNSPIVFENWNAGEPNGRVSQRETGLSTQIFKMFVCLYIQDNLMFKVTLLTTEAC